MVVSHIADKIVSGELPGGSQIRQEAIANELGVSRVPVREALLQLEADGLVQIATHRGAIVSNLSKADAVDVFEARRTLELFLLEKAVEAAGAEDYERAEDILRRYDDAVQQNASPARLSQLNWDYHLGLLQPADRPRTLNVIKTLYTSLDRYLRLQIRPRSAQAAAIRDHWQIYEAYVKRDTKTVVALSKEHIDHAYEEVLLRLDQMPLSE
ncbi:MAG: GntR family transcriptional regulator [Roseitalea sp.]|jgi:DNA-binding GntR family transcriptional regulator|nr:GntR family transcriptional regulator [Roseitalea sp.]MBO6722668.1 GntR family transcriptional regulator [Roseitalea sp.]MBO6741548.1 GntR family transcriptional regulator [Roseitalea sp.]